MFFSTDGGGTLDMNLGDRLGQAMYGAVESNVKLPRAVPELFSMIFSMTFWKEEFRHTFILICEKMDIGGVK